MQPIYEHRQFGLVILVLLIVPVLGFAALIATSVHPAPLLPLLPILIFMLATVVVFSSLTVKVLPGQVTLWFGPRVLRRSFSTREISEVRVVRNTWLHGLGIHFIRKGVVYNVSGLGAVELQLENGRRVRIGSDEPETLARAIEEARRV
jgi:hypothetical protein